MALDDFDAALQAARSGAEWAIVALYRDLQPHLLAYLRSRCPDESEDLAQETWIDVSRGLGRFDGDEVDFRRFVFTVARRRMIDHLRVLRRDKAKRGLHEVVGTAVPGGDVEEIAVGHLAADEAVAMMAALLPPDQVDVILLRVLGGFTSSEVANLIGKRANAVRTMQARALARLAEAFPSEEITEPRQEVTL